MKGAIAVLVQASDGSEAEKRRLRGLLRGRGPGRGDPPLVAAFSRDELALSLGRELVIHAALRSQEASSAFLARAMRLDDFRVGDPALPGDTARMPCLPRRWIFHDPDAERTLSDRGSDAVSVAGSFGRGAGGMGPFSHHGFGSRNIAQPG